ncbi:hypothetical protein ABC347_09265 [Sphingomonas sp. 1P06PA]|uniref:hypothetical protein n=1 Tax=Sphingomonas sp. 1P06PA TaxID=554121 RepID=UPI0039A64B3C
MTSIDRLSGTTPLSAAAGTAGDARGLADRAMGEIGDRLLAWSGAISGGASPAGFRPDTAELARGGDIYGLRQLGSELGDRLGATPTEQGTLLRAVEDFTRAAAVQIHGLAGAGSERQTAGITEARETALAEPAPEGVDGLIERLGIATDALVRQNGG